MNFLFVFAGKNVNDKNGPSKQAMLTATNTHPHPSTNVSTSLTQSSSSAAPVQQEQPPQPHEPLTSTETTTTAPLEVVVAQELNATATSNCESTSTSVSNSGELSLATTADENIDVSSIQNHAEESDSLKSQAPALNTGSLKKVGIDSSRSKLHIPNILMAFGFHKFTVFGGL